MGCGLAEYESKMKEAQQRLKQYEEEEKVLDPAPRLNPPTRTVDPALPPSVILDYQLRAPRGINPQSPTAAREDLFYDYSPMKANGALPFLYVSVAFAPLKDDKFATNLLSRIRATTEPKQTTGKTRLGLAYRRVEFDSDNSSVVVCLFQGTVNHFAVVYYVTRGQLARANRAIEMSLDTFGFDGTLGTARQAARPGGPLEHVPR
jgi:hypothetical protein